MTVATRPARRDRGTTILLLIAALIAIGGIAFALGRLTAPAAAAANTNANGLGRFRGAFPSLAPGQTFNPGQFGGAANRGLGGLGGGIEGTVDSINGSTLTIKLANGTTETVDLSGSTTYHSETAAASADVKAGSTVRVQIDTAALASESPNPSASGALGGRTLTAKDVLLVTP